MPHKLTNLEIYEILENKKVQAALSAAVNNTPYSSGAYYIVYKDYVIMNKKAFYEYLKLLEDKE